MDLVSTLQLRSELPFGFVDQYAEQYDLLFSSVVIIYDLDPNPHNDKQAEARAHRLGQLKDVTVIRLISENTVEENILQMAEVKLRLDQSVSFNQDNASDEEDSGVNSDAKIKSLVQSALHI